MAEMGEYCKAYTIDRLRAFDGWTEQSENARPADEAADTPRTLDDDAIVYIQGDYRVTDGIFKDEHVLFDDVTPEWKAFCTDELEFEVPDYESVEIDAAESDANAS